MEEGERMNILEDLWHGNIYPSEVPIKRDG